MPRTKPAALVLMNLDHVDHALHRIGEIDTQLEREHLLFSEGVEEQRKRLLDLQAPMLRERERLAQAIESYATHEKDQLFPDGDKRSIELPFGVIGWRRSTFISLSRACTPECLRTLGLEECVLVTERVSKAHLAKLEDAVLRQAGAKRSEKDTFYLELNREQVLASLQAAQTPQTRVAS